MVDIEKKGGWLSDSGRDVDAIDRVIVSSTATAAPSISTRPVNALALLLRLAFSLRLP